MLKADQIPDEVVEAALKVWMASPDDYEAMQASLSAALNAWPGMECRPTFGPSRIILPLPQEVSDE